MKILFAVVASVVFGSIMFMFDVNRIIPYIAAGLFYVIIRIFQERL